MEPNECGHEAFNPTFDDLCAPARPCPDCGRLFVVHWDETYDQETGEEEGWFELEEAPDPARTEDPKR